ncbi:glycosyltransferase [Cellulosimicrobium cellulans]|uniref:glycosyltransferase n=1 Tax=Cellulosimicrobium cellulans TaxID=1710 RepID=UPI002404C4B4|nr:glycosyltransferase [Cellulosimicrobium cellulans]MDF9875552.1 UDP:flavonoid glycosyltransferase YjiC (YdhE family) [Cellulosimicrobium cellulans]
MPRTYLFALTDGGGTVPPEVGAVRRLVGRGHRVQVLAEDSMAPEVRATGATLVPWATAPNRPDRDPAHDPLKDWAAPSLLAQARDMGDHLIAGPAPDYARDVLAAVEDERPDLVVTSVFAFGAMVAAQSRGIPFDVLIPNVYALPTPGRTPFGAGLKPARGPLGRLRDRAITGLSTRVFDRFTRDRINALRADLGLDPLARSWEQMSAARRQLVMTSPAFDLPGPLPANARYVGPVLDDPAWTDDVPWVAPPGDAPLVLVALSSTFQDQAALLRRIVAALATLPVRGIVTTGQGLAPGDVPDAANVVVVASAPHHEVLRDAALVVTHRLPPPGGRARRRGPARRRAQHARRRARGPRLLGLRTAATVTRWTPRPTPAACAPTSTPRRPTRCVACARSSTRCPTPPRRSS